MYAHGTFVHTYCYYIALCSSRCGWTPLRSLVIPTRETGELKKYVTCKEAPNILLKALSILGNLGFTPAVTTEKNILETAGM